MGSAELILLRGFALTVDGVRVPLVFSAQRLVAYLAVQERPVHRPHVAGALWPDTMAARANPNLRSALWRAHRACPQLIDTSAQQLALTADVVVDLRRAHTHADRLLDSRHGCDDILDADTRAELSAEVLPDWDCDEWLVVERQHHHQLRLHALEAMCERLTAAGRHGEAVAAGLAAVRAEPLRESAHGAVIRAHLAAGNRWEAARQYEQYRRVLHDDLGLNPAPDLRDLARIDRPAPDAGRPARIPHPGTATRRVPHHPSRV
jgi:DNA-binding SARP family transcriptional activator